VGEEGKEAFELVHPVLGALFSETSAELWQSHWTKLESSASQQLRTVACLPPKNSAEITYILHCML